MIENTIARINELYHKSQKEGLTPEEKEEQERKAAEIAKQSQTVAEE